MITMLFSLKGEILEKHVWGGGGGAERPTHKYMYITQPHEHSDLDYETQVLVEN